MKVVIVGDGKVGSTVAAQLSEEGHDVIIIDRSADVLTRAGNTMDIICIEGNGATVATQEEAGVPNADLLIAATSADEVNMLCCLLGKKMGAKHTIARVRNPEYFAQMGILNEELGLSMAVNPELASANEISRLLRFPSALKIEPFARGRVELIEMKIPAGSPLNGVALHNIFRLFKSKVLICAVQREESVFIPTGDFILNEGDKINLTGTHAEISKFCKATGAFRASVKSAMIIGGGRLAYYLAKALIATNIKVKIIEMDKSRCEYLCEALPDAVIIHGDGTERDLLHEEGLDRTDALIALTGMDEENIVIALYAKAKKVSKVIAKINKITFHEVWDSLDLDSIISPKAIAANNIVRYVRAMQNSMGSTNIETLLRVINEQVEVVEFKIKEDSPVVGVPLMDLQVKEGLLVASIIRGSKVIIPGGHDRITKGDNVIIVTREHHLVDLNDILR